MNIIPLILQILALICLAFAAFNLFQTPPNKPQWGWLGLALWLVSLMVSGIQLHAVN
jgi:steroid 5-alpha reductase family enzyme